MSNPGEEFFLSFTETIYGVLFEPAATLRSLADHKPYGTARLVFIGVLLWSVVFEQALNVYGDSQIQEMIPANLYWLFSLFGAILSLLVLLVGSGLLSLISELIYGKFNAGGILVVLCYSSIPGILGPPLHYASTLAGLQWLGAILAGLCMLWVLVLQVIGVRESLQVTTGQTILIMLLPLLVSVLLIVGMAILATMTLTI
jgi:lysylphosphatidylglycerol synthetase-like protein (DUF2156 family)